MWQLAEASVQESGLQGVRRGAASRRRQGVNRVNTVEIGPITEAHIESFHKTLDVVARERRYLAFLEAPPLESTRAFILNNIAHGYPQFVATVPGGVSAAYVSASHAF